MDKALTSICNWPFNDYYVNSIDSGKSIKKGSKTYYQVIFNKDSKNAQYIIVRIWKILGIKFYSALYYAGSRTDAVFMTPFLSGFNWDVENRCFKKWNGGEYWASHDEAVRLAISKIKGLPGI